MIKTRNGAATMIAACAMVLMTIAGCKKEEAALPKTTTYDLKVKDQLAFPAR